MKFWALDNEFTVESLGGKNLDRAETKLRQRYSSLPDAAFVRTGRIKQKLIVTFSSEASAEAAEKWFEKHFEWR